MKLLLIMGPQGSGKGTQAQLIAKQYGLSHVSLGDILREEAAKGSEQGSLIKKYMDEGSLIPDAINDSLVERVVQENLDGLLLDGYPRNRHQAEHLLKFADVSAVVIVNISDEEAVKRIGMRRICTATKKIFKAGEISEADVKECEAAGGEIVQRDDDTPDAVKRRLQIYHENTSPLIGFFKEKGVKVFVVNGEQSVDDVFGEIKGCLDGVFD